MSMKRIVETHGFVHGLAIESVSYADGRGFVTWGERLLPLSDVDALLKALREARVAAALGCLPPAEVKP
jgi:hypothetical protein